MADLVTRLKLDDKLFDDKIKKSKRELKAFQSMQGAITGSIKSLAMLLGAAAGVMEVFSTAINSNSKLLETWGDVCGTAKESVDSFFTSLSSGDWTVFEKGVMNAIKLSRQYTLSMREVRASIKIGDVRLSQDEKELNKYENLASDESRSKSDREAFFATFKLKGKETVAYVDNLSKYVNDRLSKALEAKGVHNTKPVREMIFEYLDPSTVGGQLLDKYSKLNDSVLAAYNGTKFNPTNEAGFKILEKNKERYKQLSKEFQNLNKQFPDLELAYRIKMNFGTQEELDELLDLTDKIIGYEDRLESAKKQITDLSKDFDKNGKLKPKSEGKSNPLIPEGSIAELEKQISAAKTKLKLAVDPLSRIELEKEIKSLEEKKRVIEFQYKYPNAPSAVKSETPSLAGLASVPDMLTNLPKGNDKKFKKGANAANDYADALSNCANAVAVFNSTKLEDNGEGWVQWSSNLLAAAASTIIGLLGLTMAKGVNSAFDLPFPANIAAAAMVLSTVISLFASIPAFADGGIFQSSLTTGDRNLARLNGGEMILNKGQQANLFNLLDKGGTIGNGGNVSFKISGKDLVGVLSNYNNKVSKVK